MFDRKRTDDKYFGGLYNFMSSRLLPYNGIYSKTWLKRSLKMMSEIGFQDQLSLNARQKYCRMLSWSILQYFSPSLNYHLSLRSLFCLFLSGCFRQVLLYITFCWIMCSFIQLVILGFEMKQRSLL